MINPYKNNSDALRGIAIAERGTRVASTLVGAAGAFIFGRSMVANYLPAGWWASEVVGLVAGTVAALFIGWLTDMMFGTWLQKVSFDILASKHPNVVRWNGPAYFKNMRRALTLGFVALLIGLFWFDMSLTLTIADPIADQAQGAALVNADSIRSALVAQNRSELDQLRAERKERAAAAAKAEREVAASNAGLAKLASEGNGWGRAKLANLQKKASAKYEKAAADLDAQMASVASSNAAYIEQRTAEMLAKNQQLSARNENQRAAISSTYKWCSWVPKVASILLRIMLVMAFLAYATEHTPDLNGDGVVDYEDVEIYLAQNRAKRAAAQGGGAGVSAMAGGGGGDFGEGRR